MDAGGQLLEVLAELAVGQPELFEGGAELRRHRPGFGLPPLPVGGLLRGVGGRQVAAVAQEKQVNGGALLAQVEQQAAATEDLVVEVGRQDQHLPRVGRFGTSRKAGLVHHRFRRWAGSISLAAPTR